MERLKIEECQNCKDWKGYVTDCFQKCMKPFEALEEFNWYKDLEEQGLLLKLPNDFKKWCDKIGDYIYFVTGGDIYPLLVLWIGFDGDMNFVISAIDDDKDGDGLSFEFKLGDLNKTVFLTQAEAEEALKVMES